MNPWLMLILTFIGAIYLFIVIIMAFKERGMIVNLAIINILIFLYTYIVAPGLITQYALGGVRISAGAAYTLFTYMFLHANPAHIILNSMGMLFFGYNMEKEVGGPPTLVVFFVSGLVAGGFFVMTSPATALVVGASGAIFGMMAYLTLIRPFLISPMPFLIPMPIALAAVIYTIVTIPVMAGGGIVAGVAHNAHIGGLIGGSLMAFGMNYLQALKGLAIVIGIAILIFLIPPLLL